MEPKDIVEAALKKIEAARRLQAEISELATLLGEQCKDDPAFAKGDHKSFLYNGTLVLLYKQSSNNPRRRWSFTVEDVQDL